jgi:DNA-binding response OmpR family regulator
MKVLIVEDNKEVAEYLKSRLTEEGFVVEVVFDGEKGSELARTKFFDLVVLDLGLPKKNGLVVLKEIRESKRVTPVLILSVRSEIPDRVSLLNSGADDFMVKPFSFEELMARVRALMRRPPVILSESLTYGDVVIDSTAQSVVRGGREIALTRKEFLLLEFFVRNAGKLVSRGMITEQLWEQKGGEFSNSIETHILNLRRKLNAGNKKNLIVTIPARGYKLVY